MQNHLGVGQTHPVGQIQSVGCCSLPSEQLWYSCLVGRSLNVLIFVNYSSAFSGSVWKHRGRQDSVVLGAVLS